MLGCLITKLGKVCGDAHADLLEKLSENIFLNEIEYYG